MAKAYELITKTPLFPLKGMEIAGNFKVYDAHLQEKKESFSIVKAKEGYFKIEGEEALKTYSLINTSTDEGVEKLIRYLDKLGVEEALEKAGARNGDEVSIGDFSFTYTN